MTRTLYIESDRGNYTADIPDDAKLTFGPWSPPSAGKGFTAPDDKRGTLRVYMGAKTTGDVIGVFTGVKQYYDQSLVALNDVKLTSTITQIQDTAKGIVLYSDLDDAEKEELAESVAKIITGHAVAQKEDAF